MFQKITWDAIWIIFLQKLIFFGTNLNCPQMFPGSEPIRKFQGIIDPPPFQNTDVLWPLTNFWLPSVKYNAHHNSTLKGVLVQNDKYNNII